MDGNARVARGGRSRYSSSLLPVVMAALLGAALVTDSPATGATWRKGDFEASFYSTLSMSVNVRAQKRDCRQVATINGGCNPSADVSHPDYLATEGRLLNVDDGNLNWERGDVFSVLFKGTHEAKADWRNYGAFVRFTYFADLIQIQGDSTGRTPLNREARFRGNIMESGVNGAHFLLLDAYGYALWDVGPWNIDFRVGNVALNWGESVFTQGGINAISPLDVTKIRLPGSELREALLPVPMVRLASNIWGGLSTEVYYVFDWKRTDLDPVGSFFASSDQVSRGAQGFFFPAPFSCGDPGTPEENQGTPLPEPPGGCPTTAEGLTKYPLGVPRLFENRPSDQGQFGAALRYYVEPIETEFGAYFIRFHHRYPVVSFYGTTDEAFANCRLVESTPAPTCDLGYFLEFPESTDVIGLSFNTMIGDYWAVGGEISYRPNEVLNVGENPNAEPYTSPTALFADLAGQSTEGGGTFHGFVREERLIAMLNGVYVAAPGTPFFGRVIRAIGASESNVVVEAAVVNYPSLSIGKQYYAGPTKRVDTTGFSYQLRIDMTYNRVFGSAWELVPVFAFKHDAYGNTPSNEAGVVQGRVDIGTSLEARFQNTWSFLVTYKNSFGAGVRNTSNDRDFLGFSASYAF